MDSTIDQQPGRQATGHLSRRDLLLAMLPLAAVRTVFGQTSPSLLHVNGINHVTLSVSDVKRSVDFYQGLFGMPVASRQGANTNLRIGAGPQFLGVIAGGGNPPAIDHLCLGVDDFNADRVAGILAQRGLMKIDAGTASGAAALAGTTMRMRVRARAAEGRGNAAATQEIYFSDPDGVVVQLQDPRYCGGSGALGNVCPPPEPAPSKGLLALRGWSHCTIFGADAARSNTFYQDLFGLRVQAHQGPTAPLLGVGGREFLMFAGIGGRGGAPRRGTINHLCMSMDDFNPDRVIKALESYGLKPRGTPQGPPGPLVHYVSMRMENRGGAKEGTPELYFTDPDGLLIQLQDVKYCGGAGILGEVCP